MSARLSDGEFLDILTRVGTSEQLADGTSAYTVDGVRMTLSQPHIDVSARRDILEEVGVFMFLVLMRRHMPVAECHRAVAERTSSQLTSADIDALRAGFRVLSTTIELTERLIVEMLPNGSSSPHAVVMRTNNEFTYASTNGRPVGVAAAMVLAPHIENLLCKQRDYLKRKAEEEAKAKREAEKRALAAQKRAEKKRKLLSDADAQKQRLLMPPPPPRPATSDYFVPVDIPQPSSSGKNTRMDEVD